MSRRSPCHRPEAKSVPGLPNWTVNRIPRADGKRSDPYFCLDTPDGTKRTFRSVKQVSDSGFGEDVRAALVATRPVPVRKELSPAKMSISPAKRLTSPAKQSTSPVKKSISPVKKSISPMKKSRSPAKRSTSPVKKSLSPAKRLKSPAKRSTSPAKRLNSPAKKSLSPAKRLKSPAKRSTSLATKSKSPAKTSNSTSSHGLDRSPALTIRTPATTSDSTRKIESSPSKPGRSIKRSPPAQKSKSPAKTKSDPRNPGSKAKPSIAAEMPSSVVLDYLLKNWDCPDHARQTRSAESLKRSLKGLGWNWNVDKLPSLGEIWDAYNEKANPLEVEINRLSNTDPEKFQKLEDLRRLQHWFCSIIHNWKSLTKLHKKRSNGEEPTLSSFDAHRAGHVDMSAFLTKQECSLERAELLSRLCRRYTDAPYSLDSKERRRRLEALENAAIAKMGKIGPREWLKLHPPGTDDPLLHTLFREIDRLWFDGDFALALHDAHVHLKLKFANSEDELSDASGVCWKQWCDVTMAISARDTLLLSFEPGEGYLDAGKIIRTPLQALLTTFQHEIVHLLADAACRCEWARAYNAYSWEMRDGRPFLPHPPPPYTAFELQHMVDTLDGHGPMFCRLSQTLFGQSSVVSGLDPELRKGLKYLEKRQKKVQDSIRHRRSAIQTGTRVQFMDTVTATTHEGEVVEKNKNTFVVKEGARLWPVEYENEYVRIL